MNKDQEELINELQKTRAIYTHIAGRIKDKKPLSHKNASAVYSEIIIGLKHMERMQRWIAEDQTEREKESKYQKFTDVIKNDRKH